MHLISSGLHSSIMPAASMSMLLYRCHHCGGVRGFWWTFIRNDMPAGMWSRCIMSSTTLTSLTNKANMSVKDLTRSCTLIHSSGLSPSPMVISWRTFSTHSGLKELVALVNRLVSPWNASRLISAVCLLSSSGPSVTMWMGNPSIASG